MNRVCVTVRRRELTPQTDLPFDQVPQTATALQPPATSRPPDTPPKKGQKPLTGQTRKIVTLSVKEIHTFKIPLNNVRIILLCL